MFLERKCACKGGEVLCRTREQRLVAAGNLHHEPVPHTVLPYGSGFHAGFVENPYHYTLNTKSSIVPLKKILYQYFFDQIPVTINVFLIYLSRTTDMSLVHVRCMPWHTS